MGLLVQADHDLVSGLAINLDRHGLADDLTGCAGDERRASCGGRPGSRGRCRGSARDEEIKRPIREGLRFGLCRAHGDADTFQGFGELGLGGKAR